MNTIEAIKAKCVEANPDIEERARRIVYECGDIASAYPAYMEVHLADVLLAIGEHKRLAAGTPTWSTNEKWVNDVVAEWHLTFDDLSAQSEETIEFLANILDV